RDLPRGPDARADAPRAGARPRRAPRAEARVLQPRRFPHGHGRRPLVPRGEHVARAHVREPAAAVGGGCRHLVRGALRTDLPLRAQEARRAEMTAATARAAQPAMNAVPPKGAAAPTASKPTSSET